MGGGYTKLSNSPKKLIPENTPTKDWLTWEKSSQYLQGYKQLAKLCSYIEADIHVLSFSSNWSSLLARIPVTRCPQDKQVEGCRNGHQMCTYKFGN